VSVPHYKEHGGHLVKQDQHEQNLDITKWRNLRVEEMMHATKAFTTALL
jgi:hypothetical protein